MHFYQMISCDLSSSEVGSLNSKWKLSRERLTLGQVQRTGARTRVCAGVLKFTLNILSRRSRVDIV